MAENESRPPARKGGPEETNSDRAEDNSYLSKVLARAAAGDPVIPCRLGEPLTSAEPSTDPDQIRAWWTWQPQATALVVPTTAKVLDEVEAFLRRFVSFPTDDEPAAVALWVLHTYAVDASEQSPYLAISSPVKQSGKSRVFDVLEVIAARPWRAVTPTEAVVFRKIDRDAPTILLDEVDAIFGGKEADRHEGLRLPCSTRETDGAQQSPAVWGLSSNSGISTSTAPKHSQELAPCRTPWPTARYRYG